MTDIRLVQGDSLAVLRTLPDASVDAVVTDPPYGLAELRPELVAQAVTAWCSGDRDHVPDGKGFMGRDWDAFVPPPAIWDECLRVLKPGGHLVAFAGSRTYDLMGLSIRLAGFEVRDGLAWLYGSGFPKGLDVGKAIDKAGGGSPVDHGRILRAARMRAGMTREDVATAIGCKPNSVGDWEEGRARAVGGPREVCVPSPEYRARLADLLGYTADERVIVGVASRAATEDVYGTYGDTRYGTGAATDDAVRWDGWNTSLKPAHEPIVLARKPLAGTVAANVLAHGTGALNIGACRVATGDALVRPAILRTDNEVLGKGLGAGVQTEPAGRWPTNVLLSHAPGCNGQCAPGCPVAELDAQSGLSTSRAGDRRAPKSAGVLGAFAGDEPDPRMGHADTGGASRFFPSFRYNAKAPARERPKVDGKGHPTVKPLALMQWLVRLVTPPDGTVLDPFAGSGTTGQACEAEGFDSILIDRDARWAEVRLGMAAERFVSRTRPELVAVIPMHASLQMSPTVRPDGQGTPAAHAARAGGPDPTPTEDAMTEMIENATADPPVIENATSGAPKNPAGKRRDDFGDWDRDEHGRPLMIRAVQVGGQWVVPKDADGNPITDDKIPFTRASTLGSALEYQKGLARWEAAVSMWGVVRSRTLSKRARAVAGYSQPDQKDELYEVLDKGKTLAEADQSANHGTALHTVFQRIAEGETVDQLIERGALDEEDIPAARAFENAIDPELFEIVWCERRVVCDEAQAAGKYDIILRTKVAIPVTQKRGRAVRVVDIIPPGTLIAVDNKTSQTANYFGEKFVVQLWVYAHGRDYDQETGERTDVGVSKRWALILHIPSNCPEGTVGRWHWVDLSVGTKLVHDARQVLEDRKLGKRAISPADFGAEVPADLLAEFCETHGLHPGTVDCAECIYADAPEADPLAVGPDGQPRSRQLAGAFLEAHAGETVGELVDAGALGGRDPLSQPGRDLPDGACSACLQPHPPEIPCPGTSAPTSPYMETLAQAASVSPPEPAAERGNLHEHAPEESVGVRLQRYERDRVIVKTIGEARTVEQLLAIWDRLGELDLQGKFRPLMSEAREGIESGRRFTVSTGPRE